MFDFLKGGKVNLTLNLGQVNPVFMPGDTVEVIITVNNDKELKIQNGRLIAQCTEAYLYKDEVATTDSDGDTTYSTDETWGSDAVEVFRHDFLEDGILPPGTHTYTASFTLDPACSPTCNDGRILTKTWSVKATLDRKMASDHNVEVTFRVLAPLTQDQISPAGDYGTSMDPKEAEMFFNLTAREFIHGQTILGTLKVLPIKNFEATEVRIELERTEYVYDHSRASRYTSSSMENSRTVTVEKLKLAGKTRFASGQPCEFNFQLPIPLKTPPSVQLEHGWIAYRLKGVLARFLRSDTQVAEDVSIFSGSIG